MSKCDDFCDEKILIDAIELLKIVCSENLNAVINCVEDTVVSEFKVALTTQIEILDMLRAQAKSRNLLEFTKVSEEEIKEVSAKYC